LGHNAQSNTIGDRVMVVVYEKYLGVLVFGGEPVPQSEGDPD
jgi:hypothetical protein